MTAKSIADILDAAADLITPEGAWGSGACGGPHCASTAIDHRGDSDAQTFFADFLGLERRNPICIAIWRWNDAPERTQAEVVVKLREAATLARTSTPGEA